jgi:hypothetical protein
VIVREGIATRPLFDHGKPPGTHVHVLGGV